MQQVLHAVRGKVAFRHTLARAQRTVMQHVLSAAVGANPDMVAFSAEVLNQDG